MKRLKPKIGRCFAVGMLVWLILLGLPGAALAQADYQSGELTRLSAEVRSIRAEVRRSPLAEKNYLEKLFGDLNPGKRSTNQNKTGSGELDTLGWLAAIPATLFYGPLALAAILWILFSSDLIGIVSGLIVIGLCIAFCWPRRFRPIALFVLACLGFFLAAGITVAVAFEEGVWPVLISLLPTAGLVWLAFRRAFWSKKPSLI